MQAAAPSRLEPGTNSETFYHVLLVGSYRGQPRWLQETQISSACKGSLYRLVTTLLFPRTRDSSNTKIL